MMYSLQAVCQAEIKIKLLIFIELFVLFGLSYLLQKIGCNDKQYSASSSFPF